MIYMKESKAGSLNISDWRAAGNAAVVWSAPVLLMYITAVLGRIQMQGHDISINDFVPSTLTIGAIVGWFLMQIQGLLIRWTKGN